MQNLSTLQYKVLSFCQELYIFNDLRGNRTEDLPSWEVFFCYLIRFGIALSLDNLIRKESQGASVHIQYPPLDGIISEVSVLSCR